MDQRIKIKFCFKLGKSTTESYSMIKTVYGAAAEALYQRFCVLYKILRWKRELFQ